MVNAIEQHMKQCAEFFNAAERERLVQVVARGSEVGLLLTSLSRMGCASLAGIEVEIGGGLGEFVPLMYCFLRPFAMSTEKFQRIVERRSRPCRASGTRALFDRLRTLLTDRCYDKLRWRRSRREERCRGSRSTGQCARGRKEHSG
jgi:hypothetical protein